MKQKQANEARTEQNRDSPRQIDGPSESNAQTKLNQIQTQQYQSPKFFIASPKPSQESPTANEEDHFSFQASQTSLR